MQVTDLYLYPIKSTQAYSVRQSFVQPQGLSFDREFMLTEPDGTFITARKDSVLYQIAGFPVSGGMVICFNNEQCLVRYADFQREQSSEVWGTHFISKVASPPINHWLSQILGREVQLRWIGEQSRRSVKNVEAVPMSFGDSNPVLLCSARSLEKVQQWSPIAIKMGQFRPNIVIDGEFAFEEEAWRRIKIGEVEFAFAQHCTRCILISRDLQTLELDPRTEPFRALKKQHTNEKGQPIFGIHLVPKNSGVIRTGDSVIVLEQA